MSSCWRQSLRFRLVKFWKKNKKKQKIETECVQEELRIIKTETYAICSLKVHETNFKLFIRLNEFFSGAKVQIYFHKIEFFEFYWSLLTDYTRIGPLDTEIKALSKKITRNHISKSLLVTIGQFTCFNLIVNTTYGCFFWILHTYILMFLCVNLYATKVCDSPMYLNR